MPHTLRITHTHTVVLLTCSFHRREQTWVHPDRNLLHCVHPASDTHSHDVQGTHQRRSWSAHDAILHFSQCALVKAQLHRLPHLSPLLRLVTHVSHCINSDTSVSPGQCYTGGTFLHNCCTGLHYQSNIVNKTNNCSFTYQPFNLPEIHWDHKLLSHWSQVSTHFTDLWLSMQTLAV